MREKGHLLSEKQLIIPVCGQNTSIRSQSLGHISTLRGCKKIYTLSENFFDRKKENLCGMRTQKFLTAVVSVRCRLV